MSDELERLRRESLIQSECANLLGRIVSEKDADRIFFRDKAQDLERQLSDLRAEVADYVKTLEHIRTLREQADGCAGMVDFPHTKALDAAVTLSNNMLTKYGSKS